MKRERDAKSERHMQQLPLPFGDVARMGASSAPSGTTLPPPTTTLTLSRTRLVETAIQEALGKNTRVLLTDTRSVLLSQSMRKGIRTVRVHQLFLDAPVEVRVALGAFLHSGDRHAGRMIDDFIAQQDHLLNFHAPPLVQEAGRGQSHDLSGLLVRLNRQYFGGTIEADICWGQTGSRGRKRKRSITLGNYCYRSRRITIHPALDQSFVPQICVARVIHHEMCHAKHPAKRSASGRRILHGPAFREEEARFMESDEADSWIQNNLDRLLRYQPGTCKSLVPPRSSASRTPSV